MPKPESVSGCRPRSVPMLSVLFAIAAMTPMAALAAGTFTLSCDPVQIEIEPGGTGRTRCTVSSQEGFSEPVRLSCLELPDGFSCGYRPNPVTPPADGSASSDLSIDVARDTPTGTYALRAQGRNRSIVSTATISVTVTRFGVACSPSSLSVVQNGSGTSTCTVTSTNSFNDPVSLTCSNLPDSVACSFQPGSVTPPPGGSASSTLTVSATPAAPVGTSAIQVEGTSGLIVRTTTVNLTVLPSPNIVFFDDFETDKGWIRNLNGTDTATTGLWERGDPEQTSWGAAVMQLGTASSGTNDLVTGRLAGASVGANDVDGGTTSIQSPPITLPASGSLLLTISYYFAHLNNASNADSFRVSIVSGGSTTQILQELGAATTDVASFATFSFEMSAFAGQTVRILFEATDSGNGSLIEAGVDNVMITVP